jgi:hypothetical protein
MLGALAGIVVLLFCLAAMFRREAVKRDLFERGCTPLRVWWIPFSLYGPSWGTSFRVIYRDAAGFRHKAHCYVYLSDMDSPRSGHGSLDGQWTK